MTTTASLAEATSKVGARWVGVGYSSEPDPSQAGMAAASAALRGRETRLVVVFASPAYDLEALHRSIRDLAPDVPLIGCSTAGEISTGGPGTAGVVVAALGGEGFSVATCVAPNASKDLRQAGADAASCIERVAPHQHRLSAAIKKARNIALLPFAGRAS